MPRQRNIFIDCVRCSRAFQAVVQYVIAASFFFTISSVCFAWQPVSSDETAGSDDSALSHSAVPLRNRAVQERLRRAEAMIARRELTAAIAELREAVVAGIDSQLVVKESADRWQEYRDSRSVIESLLGSLPADSLKSYRRQAEPLARAQLLKAIRDSDFETLRALPSRFPMTDAGRDSLRFLAAWHLDRQEFAAANAVARRLETSPGLSQTHRESARRIVDLCFAKLADQQAVAVPTAAVSETRRKLSIRAMLFPSLTQPDWQVDSGLDDEAATLTRHALHEHFEQSIPILPRAQPLVVDGVVLRRSLTEVSAHDLETGQRLWSSESVSEAGQSASRLTMNLSLQELMSQKLARGLQVDSLQSRLSSDGERVFTVESGAGVMPGQIASRSTLLLASNNQSQTRNRIVARHLHTGKVEWNLTADSMIASLPDVSQNAEDGGRVGDVYFCGLPTSVDQNVLGLVQVGDSLRVYAADRSTGKHDWSLDIAEVPRLSPADSDWRSLDCRVTLVDGVLVCPTGAGLLIGVDVGTRTVIWSRRYSRADTPLEVTRLPFAPTRPQRPWWQGWRDNKLLRVNAAPSSTSGQKSPSQVDGSILIAAGPDAEGLDAIDPRSGRRLWSLAVESPIDLFSDQERIVIVSRHSISAVDATSGEIVWKTPCREPVGTGYSVRIPTDTGSNARSTYHVFPVRGGSLVAVNCDNGSMLESVDRLQSLTGCLVSAGGSIVSLNPDRLTTWSMLSLISDRDPIGDAPQQPLSKDDQIDDVIDQAAFERSCGLFAEAAARLRRMDSSTRAKRELWKTLLAWINSGMLSSERISEVESEAEVLVGESSIAELIELRHAAARAAASANDPGASLRFYAKLQSLNPSGEPRFLKPEPLRSVRHDRLVQGEVLDLLAGRDGDIGERLTQEFTELSEAAAESRDPFALQRFTRQWGQLPIVASHNLDDRSRIGMRFGQKLLSVLAVADSSDRDVLVDASGKLIELYKSRSYDRDAAAVRLALQRRGVDVDSLADEKMAGSPWSSGAVTISEHAEQNLDTTFIPVPVECSSGTLFDRLNIAINPRSSRNDTIILRFYGDGFSGSWQTVLPTSASPLKSVGRMYRGWGIGHLLVLQLGAELFGISPFDASGEPRVQRLWSVDMANGNRQEDHEYTPAVTGFAEEQLTMLDAFGRPIAKVGPVRAGYLCFQTRGQLVCLDTSTGQRLWQRYELPRQAICSGDGQNIYLTQPGKDRVTVLRAVDGATVSKFRLSDAVGIRGAILRVSGSTVLTAESSLDSSKHPDALRISRLAAVSLQSADAAWKIDVNPDATVFAVGLDRLGILETSGQLQIIDAGSGEEISLLNVERPEQIKAVHVASDASAQVIALSEIAESAFLNGRSAGGRRNPSVTGQLVAIDSVTARLKWQRPVDRIRFLLDQPKNFPCLVLSYRRSRSSSTEATDSVLHVITRETGEDILNRRGASSASDFTFEPHADQNRLSIRMARRSIRLTFAPSNSP